MTGPVEGPSGNGGMADTGRPPDPAGPGVFEAMLEREGGRAWTGVAPLNPDQGANSARSPGTHGMMQPGSPTGGHDAWTGGRLMAGTGVPAPIPGERWVGARGGPFGPEPGAIGAVKAALDQAVTTATAQVKAAAMTRVVAPAANSNAGRFGLSLVAARDLGRGGVRAPGDAAIAPINPDRGVNAARSPGTAGMMQVGVHRGEYDAWSGGKMFHGSGTPVTIPAEMWAGARGGVFAPQWELDLSLHPAIARPIEAVGRVVGPPLRVLGQVATVAGRTSLAVGAVTLMDGARTGSMQAGVFTAGAGRTGQEQALDRIINQPKGSVIGAVSAKVPFTPEAWGMRTTVYAGGLHKEAEPYVFPAVVAPGQRGVPPWISGAEGRVRVVSQYNEGWTIGAAGVVTGNENFFTNHLLLANVPRINAPIARTDLLPSAARLTPADVQIGAQILPVGFLAVTEYGLGPVRAARGVQIGPAVARLMVGTQGLSGSALQAGKLDRVGFASVAPNPSYNPEDPLLKMMQRGAGLR